MGLVEKAKNVFLESSAGLSARASASYGSAPRPPGPTALLGVRNYLAMYREGLDFFTRIAREHGDIAWVKMAGRHAFLLSHPEHIEHLLLRHNADLIKDIPTRSLSRAVGQGLVTSDGDLWRSHRKLVSFAFTPRRIKRYGDAMLAVARRSLARWRDGATIDAHAEMSRLTLEVVARVLFGADVEHHADTVARSVSAFNDFFTYSPVALLDLPDWTPTPRTRRFRAGMRAIDEILYGMIAAHRARGLSDDLLSALIEARDDEDTSAAFTDRELRDQCITMFIAGHETTSLALVYSLYFLSLHPDMEARFHRELDSVVGAGPVTVDAAKNLSFTERVVKEAMRILPPVWGIGREAIRPFELAGYRVPAGTQLVMCQWVVHRDARWFPDPLRFDPDRFVPDLVKHRPRMAYFPFGAGARICIGNHFAMLEAVLLLALIGQKYRLRSAPDQRLEFTPSVTLQPKHGGWQMRVRKR